MKFKQINEDNFLEKIGRYFEGRDFARKCKEEQLKEFYPYNSLVNSFNKNGYKLLFNESSNLWKETESTNFCFIDKDLSKLVVVQYYNGGLDRLIKVYGKGNFNLLRPSYMVSFNAEGYSTKVLKAYINVRFSETIDNICNDREDLLEKETVREKYSTALFRIMEEIDRKYGKIKIDKKFSIEQMNTITGGLSKQYVSNGDLLFAIKAGCSLGQLLLYVRMLYTGQLDVGECLDIATSYYA